jgi:hypothetical protein
VSADARAVVAPSYTVGTVYHATYSTQAQCLAGGVPYGAVAFYGGYTAETGSCYMDASSSFGVRESCTSALATVSTFSSGAFACDPAGSPTTTTWPMNTVNNADTYCERVDSTDDDSMLWWRKQGSVGCLFAQMSPATATAVASQASFLLTLGAASILAALY